MGAADVYREDVALSQSLCKLDGAPYCDIRVRWT
jgi:hypothetical protein